MRDIDVSDVQYPAFFGLEVSINYIVLAAHRFMAVTWCFIRRLISGSLTKFKSPAMVNFNTLAAMA